VQKKEMVPLLAIRREGEKKSRIISFSVGRTKIYEKNPKKKRKNGKKIEVYATERKKNRCLGARQELEGGGRHGKERKGEKRSLGSLILMSSRRKLALCAIDEHVPKRKKKRAYSFILRQKKKRIFYSLPGRGE